MEGIKNVIIGVTDVMEQNNRGVQLGCYSLALVGLTVAIRRVRPFTRFKKPSDIPNHFIKERRELTGLVERIDPNGALLMIKHKPLVAIPGFPEGQLPVKISGVNVSGLGLSWLQSIVAGNEVKFVPVSKAQDYVHCEVLLPQTSHEKKRRIVNVGESLVRIGFGNIVDIDKPISQDKSHLVYCHQLQIAENYALRKKLGVRYYIKPTKSILITVAKKVVKFSQMSAQQIARVPKVIAS